MTANLNKNLSGCECQSDSTIQKTSGESEKEKVKPIEVERVKK